MLIPFEKTVSMKPEGVRSFTPFPKFDLTDNWHHATEHALCFIPSEDVKIVGFGCFRIYNDSAVSHTVQLKYNIFDSSNTNLISEGEHPVFTLEYAKFKPNDISMIAYDFTRDYDQAGASKQNPITV